MVEMPTWKTARNAVDAGNPTPLDIFIEEHEPVELGAATLFRQQLPNVIEHAVEEHNKALLEMFDRANKFWEDLHRANSAERSILAEQKRRVDELFRARKSRRISGRT